MAMSIEEMEKKLARAAAHVGRVLEDDGSHEAMADAYDKAYGMADDVASDAIEQLKALKK